MPPFGSLLMTLNIKQLGEVWIKSHQTTCKPSFSSLYIGCHLTKILGRSRDGEGHFQRSMLGREMTNEVYHYSTPICPSQVWRNLCTYCVFLAYAGGTQQIDKHNFHKTCQGESEVYHYHRSSSSERRTPKKV